MKDLEIALKLVLLAGLSLVALELSTGTATANSCSARWQ
jgi:hypothetical protein